MNWFSRFFDKKGGMVSDDTLKAEGKQTTFEDVMRVTVDIRFICGGDLRLSYTTTDFENPFNKITQLLQWFEIPTEPDYYVEKTGLNIICLRKSQIRNIFVDAVKTKEIKL